MLRTPADKDASDNPSSPERDPPETRPGLRRNSPGGAPAPVGCSAHSRTRSGTDLAAGGAARPAGRARSAARNSETPPLRQTET